MTYRATILHCLALLALTARTAMSQPTQSSRVEVSGGWTSLTSQSRELRDSGAHLQLGLSRRLQSVVTSRVRLDVGYHSLPAVADPRQSTPSSSVWLATGNAVKEIVSLGSFKPYVVAGAGLISIDQGSGREAHLVVSGGLGLIFPTLGRLSPFAEARVHKAQTGLPNSFVPFSVGVSVRPTRAF